MARKRRQEPSAQALAIADRLHSAAIHLLRRLRVADVASGLSAPQLSALSVVVFVGPIMMSELAAAEQVRPSTISRLVKDLEGRRLVKRVSDRDDGRVQRVRATAKGRRLLLQGRARRIASLAADLTKLPASERRLVSRAAAILEGLTLPPGHPRGRS